MRPDDDIQGACSYYMLHGFYKKEKITFGVNQSQFQALCKDMRLSFPVMNKVTPLIPAPARTTILFIFMATAFVAVSPGCYLKHT